MAAWSCLNNIKKLNTLGNVIISLKKLPNVKVVNYVPIRNCHERVMPIKASSYPLLKHKDLMFFYLVLGLIPLIGVSLYANLFIGDAELALIPEGYEPKHWEYYRHPITRFLARYAIVSPQERYERNLHNIFLLKEKSLIENLQYKIKKRMAEKLDYQSWYYTKPPLKYAVKYKEDITLLEEQKSTQNALVKE